jgi:hypothetical protein
MKVKIPLVLLLLLAGALGYLFGTERGRGQRDAVMARMGRSEAEEAPAPTPLPEPVGEATEPTTA